MCSISRDPRWEECTICTAVAPDAVLTVRTYGTGPAHGPGLVRNFTLHEPRTPGQPPAEPLKAKTWPNSGLSVRHLGVDVHRHIDLCMPQDSYGNPRMHIQSSEQRRTRVPHVMHSDLPDGSLGAASVESMVEIPRLERRADRGCEHEPALDPALTRRRPGFRLLLGTNP